MKGLAALIGNVLAVPMLCASLPAQAADPQNGRLLAQRTCAGCHAVLSQEARSPDARAPTFAQLAATPGMTSTALSVALTTPHAGMPMFQLTSAQATDLIAYVLGLR